MMTVEQFAQMRTRETEDYELPPLSICFAADMLETPLLTFKTQTSY